MQPSGPPPRSGRRRTAYLIGAGVLVVSAIVASVLVAVNAQRGIEIGTAGGTATSADGTVGVTFGPGAVQSGTRVAVATDEDGPPPPDMIGPLTAPFEIDTVSGHATTGRVTVRTPLPPGVSADDVVMLVEDADGAWRPLDTTYDPARGTATAQWPHFSRGIVGWFDPLFDARDAAEDIVVPIQKWTADETRRAVGWTSSRVADVASKVGEGLLAAAGGTVDRVDCAPASNDWSFTGTGPGPDLLTGCTTPFDATDDAWNMRVGNRAPYPMLISLPDAISGPGAGASFGSMDVEDAAASMLWSLTGHAIVPSGQAIDIRTHRALGSSARIDGVVDVSTLAVRALSLVAVYFSRGESKAVETELKQVVESMAVELAAKRRAGDTTYTVAEAARDLGTDSPLSRRIRDANRAQAAGGVDQALNILSFATCLIGQVKSGRGGQGLDGAIAQLSDACFEPFIKATIKVAGGEISGLTDPAAQAKMNAKLVKGAVEELLSIRKLLTASVAMRIDAVTSGRTGLTHGGLALRCQAARCAPIDAARLQALGICRIACRITGKVELDHPSWGHITLVATQSTAPTTEVPRLYASHLAALDADGVVRWQRDLGELESLAAVNPPIDRTGHVFLTYNPGRYDGLIVLNPVGDAIADFGSLPSPDPLAGQRFYGAHVVDTDGDGTDEIRGEFNTCTPTCADANYTYATYRWNGTDYVQ